MTKRIFTNAFLLGVSVLLICSALFFALQYKQNLDDTYDALKGEAIYAANGLEYNGREYLESLEDINRITWIAADGRVIYDSEYPTLATNQKDCVEVKQALKSGEGHGARNSEVGKEMTMYFALLCKDGTVLRLSRPLNVVQYALISVSFVLWVLLLVVIISAVVSFRIAKLVIRPINNIDIESPNESDTYSELGFLVNRLSEQKNTIKQQMEDLKRKQKEFAAITDSMAEGLLVVDTNSIILSANSAALRLADGSEIGEKVRFAESSCAHALEKALDGSCNETLFEYNGRSWWLIANPVLSKKQVTGAVVLTLDVTEREQRDLLRREFTANVSHELKTPLTSISGFAELINGGMCSEEQAREFAGDIYRESQRMITLIDDIIRLSQLDEDDLTGEFAEIDLYEICENILDSLRPAADKLGVSLSLSGESATIQGVWQMVYEMIYNLCDNAVKYNVRGGKANIAIENTADCVTVSVIDTGIGIPYGEQSRIFERFYRVDKSHSKKIGGTGLGLSIVKHSANLHNAVISLDSKENDGTTVTVKFIK